MVSRWCLLSIRVLVSESLSASDQARRARAPYLLQFPGEAARGGKWRTHCHLPPLFCARPFNGPQTMLKRPMSELGH